MQDMTVISAFYHFFTLPDYAERKAPLLAFCNERKMKGTILLASEGINSTIAGSREAMDALMDYLRDELGIKDLVTKESFADFQPFQKMKVRLKQEIVRLGVEDLDITRRGEYVAPEDWDALMADPDVVLVDTRNDYEVEVGTFAGALNPATDNFREFPVWAEEHLQNHKDKKIAMFCTGGIRCEKSTALLKQLGFEKVYHLQGGILQYLENTKNKNGNWQGDCFVFDDRVAVNEHMQPSTTLCCKVCAAPITTDDLKITYSKQVCSHCIAEMYPKQG